jgi:enoyl-CoA hydratase/carnithine racemase
MPLENSVLVQKRPSGITTICINRPHRRNAVDGPTAHKLHAAFISFDNDKTQKVCVLHGSQGNFCAGADLQEVAKISNSTSESKEEKSNPMQPVTNSNPAPMGPSRMTLSKPVIAAVAGHAVAGGLELSLLADLRVVEEDAVFGVFCRRFGVPLIDGGTVRLQRIIGLGRAMDMILTGRAVGAQEALGMGLANRVVPKGKAVEEAMALATQLLKFPDKCMNVDRKSVYYAAYEAKGLQDALEFEFENGKSVVLDESVQGAARFRDGIGRHGVFDGKAKL